jgi:outer membrane protein TolC
MKSKAMSLLISIVITSLYFAATSGQQAKDSLSQYMEIAAKHNPDILQSFNEYQAALQKVFQVGGLPDPEINIGVFLSPMELVSGNQVADLQLMQMFPWFGTLRNAKDEMSQMAQAKYEAFMDVKLQVYYEVQQTYYELFKVKQGINISEKNIDIMHTIERLALVKFKTSPAVNGNASVSGASSLTDLYRIQIEIGELENNTALLKNQQNSLIAQFNGYLNRDAMSRVFLPDSLPIEILNMPLEDISDSMLVNNPMLGMLQYEQQSLDARKKMAIKMGYPMIGLGLNYTVINKNEMSTSTMNGKDMVMPMVTLTLPVYRKKYRALQEEADLLKTAKAQNYASAVNSLKTQYYQAVQSYQDAQRRIVLYTNQGRLAGQSFNIMVKSFAADGSGLTDILRVFQQTLDYDYKKIEAITDFNAAVARLKQLMALQQPSTDL